MDRDGAIFGVEIPAKNEGERVTGEELDRRYGEQIRQYVRGFGVVPAKADELLTDVLVGHMTGFLPHMGGFKEQSSDFQRLTLLLHHEFVISAGRSRQWHPLGAVMSWPDDALEPLEPETFTRTRETG